MIPNGPYSPITDSKSSRGGAAEYQLFPREYFSGSDIKIYFGDQLVDEITGLEFQLSEPVMPIYGYASYTPDAWARGARLVNGSFTINFKESYYLYNLMQLNQNNIKAGKKPTSQIMTFKINDVSELTQNMNSSTQFEELANKYQNAIWGDSVDDQNITSYINNKPYDTNFFPNAIQSDLHKNGFNIVITYGTEQKQSSTVYNNNELISSTVKTINGVQLMGVSQQINGSGVAIQETYTFLAADLDYNPGILYKK